MFVQSLFSVLRYNQRYYLYVVSTCYVINIPNLIQSEKRLTRLYYISYVVYREFSYHKNCVAFRMPNIL